MLPALALSLALVGGAVSVISNGLSRGVEKRADAFALRLTDAPAPFISFERRITLQNVSQSSLNAQDFAFACAPSVSPFVECLRLSENWWDIG